MNLQKLCVMWLVLVFASFSVACSGGTAADGDADGDTENDSSDYDWPDGDGDASEDEEDSSMIDGDKDGDKSESDGEENGDIDTVADGDVDDVSEGDAEDFTEGEAEIEADAEQQADGDLEEETEHYDLCEPDPCNGHGLCDPDDGSCDCHAPYEGEFCDECSAHFTEYPICIWDGSFPEGYCEYNQCWPVTPTGQTICYDGELSPINPCPGGIPAQCGDDPPLNFCGQDAQYADRTRTFDYKEVSGDVIVEDSLTGLVWAGVYASDKSWQWASDYCHTLEYAGYSDWRLPGPHELASLVNYATYLPSSDFAGMPNTFFWSSRPYDDVYMWAVWYFYGMVTIADREVAECDVRCVRQDAPGGRNAGFSAFIEGGTLPSQALLTHVVTGLVWQNGWASGKTWQNALAYCEALSYGGHSDWRMPNVNELRSLVAYNRVNPASDFPDMPSEYFWTSSTRIGSAYHVWGLDFRSGLVYEEVKINEHYVRCVRGD